MTSRNATRVLQLVAAALFVLGITAPASASCLQSKFASTYNAVTGQYVYWVSPSGYQADNFKVRGRFWKLGSRATANEGSCSTPWNCSNWLYFGLDPRNLGLYLSLSSPGIVGCPTGRAVAVAENLSNDGYHAAFLVGTQDEIPGGSVTWDYTVLGFRNLVPIPAPRITNTSRMGTNVTVDIVVDSAASAAFGPAGAGVISGYKVVYATGASDPGRDAGSYTQLAIVAGSSGGSLNGQTLDCSNPVASYQLAVQVLFDGDVVGTQFVSAVTTVPCSIACQAADGDGDGYYGQPGCGTAVDCNDANPAIHPGALEQCNNVDDNCNGSTDEGLGQTLYRDADGDGYGDPSVTQVTCFSPAGWIVQAGDCDDTKASVHPGAAETCNGIDDNCNTQVDEDDQGVDSDGDGVHNLCDNCRLVANSTQTDSDGDHVGNACDNCINAANSSQSDGDHDGRGDACDNCPTIPNGFQDDTDSDMLGDACDNCPLDYNSAQSDGDHDGEGDLCDLNDGLIYVLGTDDENYVEWQAENGPTAWNVYQGDLGVLRATGVYTQVPGSNTSAERHCGVTDPFVADFGVPAAGAVKFSLVTGVTGGVEGSLGTNSAGVPRPNTNPCP